MPSADRKPSGKPARSRRRAEVLCTGIAVMDAVFRVDRFPQPEAKTQASTFLFISGGCAANAAIAVARLNARARFAGPLGGPAGADPIGDRILASLAAEHVACVCPRVAGVASSISAISIDRRGERAIVNYRDDRLGAARPDDPAALVGRADAVLADNRFPEFALPICAVARARSIPVVLDADKPMQATDPLLASASHVVFSAECLRATAATGDLVAGLARIAATIPSFLAVTDGANGIYWRAAGARAASRHMGAFAVKSIDTLAAGDVFHGAFALGLAEGRGEMEAMRFAAAAAALKCAVFGGITGAPQRAEVDAFLKEHSEMIEQTDLK